MRSRSDRTSCRVGSWRRWCWRTRSSASCQVPSATPTALWRNRSRRRSAGRRSTRTTRGRRRIAGGTCPRYCSQATTSGCASGGWSRAANVVRPGPVRHRTPRRRGGSLAGWGRRWCIPGVQRRIRHRIGGQPFTRSPSCDRIGHSHPAPLLAAVFRLVGRQAASNPLLVRFGAARPAGHAYFFARSRSSSPLRGLKAMSTIIDSIEQRQLKRVPRFAAGDRVRVHFQVVEGTRRRTQVFEGVVMGRSGSGARETFTVRKQSFGVGVERTFPVHSPKIERLEVVARGDVRRAKLYYLRGRVGKRARVAERRWGIEDDLVLTTEEDEATDSEGLAQNEAEPEVQPEEGEGPEGEGEGETQGEETESSEEGEAEAEASA